MAGLFLLDAQNGLARLRGAGGEQIAIIVRAGGADEVDRARHAVDPDLVQRRARARPRGVAASGDVGLGCG